MICATRILQKYRRLNGNKEGRLIRYTLCLALPHSVCTHMPGTHTHDVCIDITASNQLGQERGMKKQMARSMGNGRGMGGNWVVNGW